MNDKALVWIRSSQGSDDDIGLQDQRETLPELADEVADEYDVFDLGIQTGFSTMRRDPDEYNGTLLDQLDEVQQKVSELESGEYDYLIAWDDRRVARDAYRSIIEYACTQGNADVVYWLDVPEDDLAYDIRSRVEQAVKEEEIKKSKRAIKQRQADGLWQGAAPFGTEHGDGPRGLGATDEFTDVLQILNAKCRGESHRGAILEAGLERSASLVTRMLNNEDRMKAYQELAAEEGYWFPRVMDEAGIQ